MQGRKEKRMYEKLQTLYSELERVLKNVRSLPYYNENYWCLEEQDVELFMCLASAMLFFLELRSHTNVVQRFVSPIRYTLSEEKESGLVDREEVSKKLEATLELAKQMQEITASIIDSDREFLKSYVSYLRPKKTYMNRKVLLREVIGLLKLGMIEVQPCINRLYSIRTVRKSFAAAVVGTGSQPANEL